jgi:cytochrome c556
MKRVLGSILIASFGLAAGTAMAQAKPEDTVKFRKANYTVIAWHMRPLAAMVKGERPMDAAEAARNANIIAMLAPIAATAFPAGTEKTSEQSRAKPEIWSQPDKFKQYMDRFAAEATKMADAAKSGNPDSIKTQFGALGKACGTCHDDFRTK